MIFEASGLMNPIHDIASSVLGFEIRSLFNTRTFFLDNQRAISPGNDDEDEEYDDEDYDDEDEEYDDQEEEAEVEKQYGEILEDPELQRISGIYLGWLRDWCRAELDLVEYSHDRDG
jgi:hypothetical protein